MTNVEKFQKKKVSLDGEWSFFLDKENIGVSREWFKEPKTKNNDVVFSSILVPSCWEEYFPNYDGVGWYYREFEIFPLELANSLVHLYFGAVNYYAEVWVNGWYVGSHEGGYTPFSLDVSTFVKAGSENFVYVRVIDPGRERIEGFTLSEVPAGKESWLYNFGGIWQSVSLEYTSQVWIERCHIDATIDSKQVNIKIHVMNNLPRPVDVNLATQISAFSESSDIAMGMSLSNHSADFRVLPGENDFSYTLDGSKLLLWSIDSPNLYIAGITLSRDGMEPVVTNERFGVREFTIRDGNFFLNDKKIILKSILTQGYYPITFAYPENSDMARKELKNLQKAGFNMLRLHIKTTPKITLELADEMGILIYEEAPNGWMVETAHMQSRCLREVREMILRDYNHPSIVIWGMMNEHHDKLKIRYQLSRLAQFMDPTRLIIDDSGGWTGGTKAYAPWVKEPINITDLHIYKRYPTSEAIYDYFAQIGKDREFTFMSEYGFGGMQDLEGVLDGFEKRRCKPDLEDYAHARDFLAEMKKGFDDWGLKNIYPSVRELCFETQRVESIANKIQTEALRINTHMAGYSMTALAAAGWEQHGLMDIWREPKECLSGMADAQRPLYVAVRTFGHNHHTGVNIPLECIVVNDDGLDENVTVNVTIDSTETKSVLPLKNLNLKKETLHSPAVKFDFSVDKPGTVSITVEIKDGNVVITDNIIEVEVFAPCAWNTIKVPVIVEEADSIVERFLKERGVGPEKNIDATKRNIRIVPRLDDDWLSSVPKEHLVNLHNSVLAGDTLLVLSVGNVTCEKAGLLIPDFSPDRFVLKESEGHFVGVFHWIKDHPFFAGLPSKCLAHQVYQNIVAAKSLPNADPKTAVAGCFQSFDKSNHQWWAADLTVTQLGKGSLIISMLQIAGNLGIDPAAEQFLFNCLRRK